MFTAIDLPTRELLATHRLIPLVEAQCQFFSPLLFDDEVELVSAISEVRNKVIKLEHRFYRGETFVASGYEIRAWAARIEGMMKAQPIPDEIRRKLLATE